MSGWGRCRRGDAADVSYEMQAPVPADGVESDRLRGAFPRPILIEISYLTPVAQLCGQERLATPANTASLYSRFLLLFIPPAADLRGAAQR